MAIYSAKLTLIKPTTKVGNVELQHMIADSNDTVVGFKDSNEDVDHDGSNALSSGHRNDTWGTIW